MNRVPPAIIKRVMARYANNNNNVPNSRNQNNVIYNFAEASNFIQNYHRKHGMHKLYTNFGIKNYYNAFEFLGKFYAYPSPYHPNMTNNNTQIQWQQKVVNQLPNNNVISLNNFKNGDKAIMYKAGTRNMYITPNSFNGLLRTQGLSMSQAFRSRPNKLLFKNPLTREVVKREDIQFVTLKKRNAAKKNLSNSK